MVRRCQSQEQATENDMQEFQQQRKPTTKTGKCLHACLMESIGLVMNLFKLSDFIRETKIYSSLFFCPTYRLKTVRYR